MALERYIKTTADTSIADLLTALRTVHIGIIGPTASGTPGAAATYTSKASALAGIGASTANGAYVADLVTELYRVNDSQKVTIGTTINPSAFGGYTPTTISGGLLAGATTATVASATGLSSGDYIKMVDSASTPVEVYRKISITGTTITFGTLEKALTGTITVTKITQANTTQLAAARTAVGNVTGVEVYVEITDNATELTAIKTFLSDRETEEKFTLAIIGEPVGQTLPGSTSATVTLAQNVNSKRVVYVPGDVTLKDTGKKVPAAAAVLAATLADMVGKQRVQTKALLSLNDMTLPNISDYTAYTKADRTALTNGNCTVFINKTIAGISSYRVYQVVTTYNKDSQNNPSTVYSNISDIMVEDLMRSLVSADFDAWSAELTAQGDPLTTTSDDLAKIKGHEQALLSTFSFLDTDFNNRVDVTSPSANAVQVKLIYKAVNVAHQIELVFVKNIRA